MSYASKIKNEVEWEGGISKSIVQTTDISLQLHPKLVQTRMKVSGLACLTVRRLPVHSMSIV